MCTTESTFAWVGVILVNAAFISFIAWGASTIWWFGFAISIVYTLILFYLARFVDRKSGWDTNDTDSEPGSLHLHDEADVRIPDDADDADAGYAASRSSGGRSMPLLANLLYGLFALALGVTGYFLPVNIFYCPGDKSYPYQSPGGHWTTNITALPSDVQDWASPTDENNQYRQQYASFIYIPGEKVTLFQGSAADSASGGAGRNGLWAVPASVFPSESAAPINFPGIQDPSRFILLGNGKACFSAYKKSLPPPPNPDPNPFPVRKPSSSIVACCDGKTLRTTSDSDNPSDTTLQSPHDFFVANSSNTLWWKGNPPYTGPRIGTGTLVYSIEDFSTMEANLHSTFKAPRGYTPPTTNDDNDAECWKTRNKIEWQRSIMALFLCALPVTIVSVLLWMKRQAPSMAVTTFIGLSAAATFLFIVVTGGIDDIDDLDSFSQWWYSVSGALWMIVMTDLTFSKIARGPLIWGINFGALSFFVGMIALTGIFNEGQVWQWIVFNAFAVIPIAIFGISTNQVFLLVLCAIGWLMDSFHIATLLSDSRSDDVTAPVFFVVLGISGLLIAGAGWLLNQHEEEVREILRDYMKKLSISRRLLPAEFDHVALQTEDPLLGSTEIPRHSGDGEAC